MGGVCRQECGGRSIAMYSTGTTRTQSFRRLPSGDPLRDGEEWAAEFLGETPSSFSVRAFPAGWFGGPLPAPPSDPLPPPTLGGATGISLPVQGCGLPAAQVQRRKELA